MSSETILSIISLAVSIITLVVLVSTKCLEKDKTQHIDITSLGNSTDITHTVLKKTAEVSKIVEGGSDESNSTIKDLIAILELRLEEHDMRISANATHILAIENETQKR
jgi:hypothetical protein